MSLPFGFVLKDRHLLKGMAALVVVSLLVPGVFGVGPPQYFSDDAQQVSKAVLPDAAITPEASSENKDAPAAANKSANKVKPETAIAANEPASPSAPDSEDVAANEVAGNEAAGEAPAKSAETVIAPPAKLEDRVTADKELPVIAADGDSTTRAETAAPVATAAAALPDKTEPQQKPAAKPVTRAEIQQTIAALKAPDQDAEPEEPAVRASVDMDEAETLEVASLQRTAKLPAPASPKPPLVVARTFQKAIPETHLALPVKKQKEAFIAMLLPLVLAANDEIGQRRQAIMRAADNEDRLSLEKWARLYRIKINEMSLKRIEEELLRRADAIPVSLALAQGAIESGWGTSRFAMKGNALFGQWAWDQNAGLKPIEASNSRAVVRSFPNLFGSVRAYMHNLNTHAQYARFRERRDLLRGRKRHDLGTQLSVFLDGYAEIGMAYVDKIQTIIRINDFGRYESARLQ